ncbi:hypothetical protein EBZ80_07015 [bacterium]|nr:hypothetical protein [bacterium]
MGLEFNLSDGTILAIKPDLGAKLLRLSQRDASGKESSVEIPFDDLKEITKKIVEIVKFFI